MMDPTFRNTNRLFVKSFKAGGNVLTRDFFDVRYMPLVEMKDLTYHSTIIYF